MFGIIIISILGIIILVSWVTFFIKKIQHDSNKTNDKSKEQYKFNSSEKIPTLEELIEARKLYILHRQYLDSGDIQKGIDLCIQAATMGDIYAQYDLAIYYDNNSFVVQPPYYDKEKQIDNFLYDLVNNLDLKGVLPQDNQKAFYWFMKAATNNTFLKDNSPPNTNAEAQRAKAQYNVGVYYENGNEGVVDKNLDEAINWYEKAAEHGIIDAQFNLSILLRNRGDKEKSVYWCSKAAEKEDVQGQFNLGVAYFYGDGIEQDIEKAIFWLESASKKGHPKAKKLLNDIKGNSTMSSTNK